MNFKNNGEDVKLKFGVKFCRVLDEIYTIDYRGMEFGMGVNLAAMAIEQRNPSGLSNIIRAASAHKGYSEDEVDEAVEEYADKNGGLGKLFTAVKDELG